MPFLGSTPAEQYKSLAKQTITGDGSTSYTLNRSVTNEFDIEVFINNVRQEPTTSYSASGNTITFTAAVTASDSCYLIYQGQSVGTINPPTNSVGGAQIQNSSVTTAHLHTDVLGPITVDASNNRVGINASTPDNGLHVAHPTGGAEMKIDAAAGHQSTYLLAEGGVNKYNIASVASDNHFQVYNYYNNTRALGISDASIITQPYQPIVALQPDTTSNVTTGNGNSKRVGWKTVGGRQTLARAGITIGPTSAGDYIANGNNTGRLTFTTGGVYYFDCTIRLENSPTSGNIYVHFNGTTPHRMHVEAWARYNYAHGRVSRCITAAANDWIEFGVAVPGGTFSGSNDTVNWLTIIKVA